MTDTTTATSTDLQDPLPEASWLWRRVFVFVVTGVVLWFLWGAMDKLGNVAILDPRRGVPALLDLCKWIIGMTAMMSTYYLIAPSAEQLVKTIQVAGLLRDGVQMAGRQVIDKVTGTSDTATTVGRPPVAPIPDERAHIDARQGTGPDGPPWDAARRG